MKLAGDELIDFLLEALRELAEIAHWSLADESLSDRADRIEKGIQELQRFRKPPDRAAKGERAQ